MNTKSTIIGIITVLVIALIGYLIYTYTMKNPDETQNEQQQQVAANAASTTTPQVQGQEVKVGQGREAVPNTQVTVEYLGRLVDGTVFDSSQAQGKPLSFVLGSQGIIPGFQIGVRGMKEGGERIIAIPPELGYGDQQVGPIPPNSTLIFELTLIKVEDAPAASAQ